MNNNIGKFEKVSYKEFEKSVGDYIIKYNKTPCDNLKILYDTLKMPIRKTKHSAGYDIYFPFEDTTINPGEILEFYTCIKVEINDGWFLGIFPKSGISFKYKIKFVDTISVIDGDYYNTENEGNICIKLENCGDKPFTLKYNEPIAQGIFMQYGLVYNDCVEDVRTGGLGSTYNLV